jgi:hypothetical protein
MQEPDPSSRRRDEHVERVCHAIARRYSVLGCVAPEPMNSGIVACPS